MNKFYIITLMGFLLVHESAHSMRKSTEWRRSLMQRVAKNPLIQKLWGSGGRAAYHTRSTTTPVISGKASSSKGYQLSSASRVGRSVSPQTSLFGNILRFTPETSRQDWFSSSKQDGPQELKEMYELKDREKIHFKGITPEYSEAKGRITDLLNLVNNKKDSKHIEQAAHMIIAAITDKTANNYLQAISEANLSSFKKFNPNLFGFMMMTLSSHSKNYVPARKLARFLAKDKFIKNSTNYIYRFSVLNATSKYAPQETEFIDKFMWQDVYPQIINKSLSSDLINKIGEIKRFYPDKIQKIIDAMKAPQENQKFFEDQDIETRIEVSKMLANGLINNAYPRMIQRSSESIPVSKNQ